MVADKAVAMIIGALTGALPYYIVGMLSSSYNSAKGLHDFATLHKVFSDKALRAVNIFYGSYNSQCNILAYYGAKAYLLKKAWSPEIDVSSGQKFVANSAHTWNGNPWDYTQPAACRIVVDKYPY